VSGWDKAGGVVGMWCLALLRASYSISAHHCCPMLEMAGMDHPGWLMSAAFEAAFAGEGGDRCPHGAAAPLASTAVSKIQRC